MTDRPTLTVYLAARYSRREELQSCAEDLTRRGHTVTARWLDDDHGLALAADEIAAYEAKIRNGDRTDDVVAFMERCAGVDVGDLLSADTVISFTEPSDAAPGGSRGGRHVEFGIAFGANVVNPNASRRLVVVGPVENVFHAPSGLRRFDDWSSFLVDLDEADAEGPCGFTSLDPTSKVLIGPCVGHRWHAGMHSTDDETVPPNRKVRRSRR